MMVAATIALCLFLWWSSITVCMLVDWLKFRKQPPPDLPPGSMPPPPEKRWPSLRDYKDEPLLIFKVVIGCAVTALLAFIFLPMIVGVLLFSPRPKTRATGESAGT